MNKLLLGTVAVLVIGVAALSAMLVMDGDGEAQASSPVDCSVQQDVPEAGKYTVTCTGEITVDAGPLGEQTISFSLVVVATDSAPEGPSFGDTIDVCTLDTGTGQGPTEIHVGPCP